jgi:hypothetical protein
MTDESLVSLSNRTLFLHLEGDSLDRELPNYINAKRPTTTDSEYSRSIYLYRAEAW